MDAGTSQNKILTPFYEDEWVLLYVGDGREVLPLLPKEVAQCCVSSPPYFGLRDYETATWQGGDAECDHLRKPDTALKSKASSTIGGSKENTHRSHTFNSTCGRCGAVRIDSQIGLEDSPESFTQAMVDVFEDVKRALKKSGSLWLNLGDSFSGSGRGTNSDGSHNPLMGDKQKSHKGTHIDMHDKRVESGAIGRFWVKPPEGFKPKDLMLIPHTVAMALRSAGWWLRQAFPYVKRSAMPESVTDRAANALEYVFHLTKSKQSFYDADGVRVGMAASSIQRLSQDVDSQSGSTRGNGGGKTNGIMKAVGHIPGNKTHRGAAAYENGDEYQRLKGGLVKYAEKKREEVSRDRSFDWSRNGITGSLDETPAGSRNFRNTELWFESVDTPHGLTFLGDDIVGIDCNPEGFSAEFCTACGRYYHNARDKKEIVREKTDDDKTISHCICGETDSWLSHFATFPVRFAAAFIKCATSEKGECSECGKTWVRVSNVQYLNPGNRTTNGPRSVDNRDITAGFEQRLEKVTETLGWRPQCECDADAVPQIVLEPFSGAGTTMIAARKLGRRCIAIELNPEYARMSVERYKRVFSEPVDPPRRESSMPLFEQEEMK